MAKISLKKIAMVSLPAMPNGPSVSGKRTGCK